jgi:hypothetical protein
MAQITTFHGSINASNFALGAAASGDTAECGTGVYLWVKNGDSSSHTVTIATPGNLSDGDAYPDKVYTVPAGEMWPIPMLTEYRDPTDSLAHLTWSATTSMTRGVFKGGA